MAHNGSGIIAETERELGTLIDKGREAAHSAREFAAHELERAGEVARAHPDALRVALIIGGGALWVALRGRAERRRMMALATALDHLRRQARHEDVARLGRAARAAVQALPHAVASGAHHLPRLGHEAGQLASAAAHRTADSLRHLDGAAIRRGLARQPGLFGGAMLLLGACAGRALARRAR